jgi:hypothetical protein
MNEPPMWLVHFAWFAIGLMVLPASMILQGLARWGMKREWNVRVNRDGIQLIAPEEVET